jgi:hypothetical protein
MDELILKEREYRDKLTQTSNEIGLPAFIMKAVVKDLFEQLTNLEQQQYQEALAIKEQKEKEAENEESKGDEE